MNAAQIAARRAALTARQIAADPVAATFRREGRDADLALTVGVVRAGARASRAVGGEASGQAQSDVTIVAPAGSDIRKGDRMRVAGDGSVYAIGFVMPGQDGRIEADAVAEQ